MIIAFTGAGISRDSGIRTFMEQPHVREKLYRSFATSNPKEYNKTIQDLYNVVALAEPNDAHYALAEFGIFVVTMNIDGLHELAGSEVLALHGTLPHRDELNRAHELWNKPVLYGDPAPNYAKAMRRINTLGENDVLLVVGASRHTAIAVEIRELAYRNGAEIIEIQANAAQEVRKIITTLKQEGKL